MPGPISDARIKTYNGMTLEWNPPRNPNGEIYHYLVEWSFKNATHKQKVTELKFSFPNTTSTDFFNITVRAFGSAGEGIPLFVNPEKFGKLPTNNIGPAEQQTTTIYFDSFMIFAIIFISLIIIVLLVGFVLCRQHRYCKNTNGIVNSEQSSFPPTTSPLIENVRTDEMYEMQTLIPASVMVNGRDAVMKAENTPNGGIVVTDNQKILRTSTPTDESIDRMCIELPPIRADDALAIQIDPANPQSFLETFSAKVSGESKDIRNGSLKVNGNSSPYKCFQVSLSLNLLISVNRVILDIMR